MLRYCKLWSAFGDKEFTRAQADQTLSEDKTAIGVILSQIRKAGWLETRLDETDARKRKYTLVHPMEMVKILVQNQRAGGKSNMTHTIEKTNPPEQGRPTLRLCTLQQFLGTMFQAVSPKKSRRNAPKEDARQNIMLLRKRCVL